MPALLNGRVVTCVAIPEQDDDARGVQDNVVADLSGSGNDRRGPVQNVEVAIDSLLFDMIAMFIEDVADTQCRTRPNVEALAGVAQDERHAPSQMTRSTLENLPPLVDASQKEEAHKQCSNGEIVKIL